jgi:hypothetical protein
MTLLGKRIVVSNMKSFDLGIAGGVRFGGRSRECGHPAQEIVECREHKSIGIWAKALSVPDNDADSRAFAKNKITRDCPQG